MYIIIFVHNKYKNNFNFVDHGVHLSITPFFLKYLYSSLCKGVMLKKQSYTVEIIQRFSPHSASVKIESNLNNTVVTVFKMENSWHVMPILVVFNQQSIKQIIVLQLRSIDVSQYQAKYASLISPCFSSSFYKIATNK